MNKLRQRFTSAVELESGQLLRMDFNQVTYLYAPESEDEVYITDKEYFLDGVVIYEDQLTEEMENVYAELIARAEELAGYQWPSDHEY